MTSKRKTYRRRTEKTLPITDDKPSKWKSLKGKQPKPTGKICATRIYGDELGYDAKCELERALLGKSERIDRYDAARLIVLEAMQRGAIKDAEP